MAFGELLREFRLARGMTLRQLGEKAGMDYIVLNKIELGLRMPPPFEGIVALADALELSEDEFSRLLDSAAEKNKESAARFTSDQLERLRASGTAQAFFTRRERDKEG